MNVCLITDRRLQENNSGVGDFQVTRAMAIVLIVAGSLVVVACGAATFLRYRRDDDDDEEQEQDQNQNGGDRTVIETSTMCITTSGNKTLPTDELSLPVGAAVGAQQHNTAITNISNNKMSMTDKEYRNGRNIVGGRIAVGPRISNINRESQQSIGVPGDSDGQDVSGTPITVMPPSHVSPTSILRGATSSNVYGVKIIQHKSSLPVMDQSTAGLQGRSYHRNPDIIPAPLMSPASAVYSNYNNKGKKQIK